MYIHAPAVQPRLYLALGCAIILLASALQFSQLSQDLRLLPDEAHFMTFARGAAVNGDWLLPGPLDKPPLSIYGSALALVAFGIHADSAGVLQLEPLQGEFAGKLPNVFMALMTVALLLCWARRLRAGALLTAAIGIFGASSPYMLAYGASAFTDMSMLFALTVAAVLAQRNRWGWAGLALGAAFCCKQQALLALPLFLGWIWWTSPRAASWLRLLLPFAALCTALLLWDSARMEPSLFLQAAANNAPDVLLAAPATWLPRLSLWLERSAWLLAVPLLTVAAFALAAPGSRHAAACLFPLVAYSCLHIILQVPLYDRYVLPLLPLLLGFVARALASAAKPLQGALLLLSLAGLGGSAIALSAPARPAIGGDRASQAGIAALAEHINRLPTATVLYDPWAGWQLGYYLGQWHDKRRVHYPTAQALVAGALALDEAQPRYFVVPLAEAYTSWLRSLQAAGFAPTLAASYGQFALYRLLPPKNCGYGRCLSRIY